MRWWRRWRTIRSGQPDVESLWLTEPLRLPATVKGAMFSGGVGEYVYGREERDFGDLGRRFGRAVRERIDSGRLPLSAAAGRRVHPRDGARRVGVQRAALGQHGLHLEPAASCCRARTCR